MGWKRKPGARLDAASGGSWSEEAALPAFIDRRGIGSIRGSAEDSVRVSIKGLGIRMEEVLDCSSY